MDRTPPMQDSDRIEQLERRIAELDRRLSRLSPMKEETSRRVRARALVRERRGIRWAFRGEQWTGRAGLSILFLGLVFLFQYSVEQGWITPAVRIGFGVVLGGVLLGVGLRAARIRPSYGALLLAGSISVFYATGWAASYLFQLVDRPLAFAWMAGVTMLAFALARRQDQPALASLGAMGGFATPFLLTPGHETPPELVVYTTLVVFWAAGLYLIHGWRSVLWTYLLGGALVLGIATGSAAGWERWLLQLSLLIVWVTGAALPFLREDSKRADNPHPRSLIPFALELRLLGAGGTALVLAVTRQVWSLSDAASGWLFLLAAAGFGAFAWIGTRQPNFVARSAAPVAGALLATATFFLLPAGPIRWYAVAAQAAAALAAGSTPRFRGVEWVGHGLFAIAAFSFVRAAFSAPGQPFDPLAFSFFAIFATAAAAARFLANPRTRSVYRIGAHALVLAWLAREFAPLSSHAEWVTVAWGAYGGILVLFAVELGRRQRKHLLGAQALAGSALALTVGKLLLIDIVQVAPAARIPLFLGCGIALLIFSAVFQRSLATRNTSSDARSASAPLIPRG